MKWHRNHELGETATVMAMACLFVLCPHTPERVGFAQSGTVQIDDSRANAAYANACTIQRTSDDVVFDFAFFANPQEVQTRKSMAGYRLVTNAYTAKRMSQALALTVDRHESVFGKIQVADQAIPSVNGRDTEPLYANFCRITGTPEEIILDLGLNSEPVGVPTKPIPVSLRIVLNFRVGKRLSRDLEVTLKEFEAEAGALELDVQKRVKTQPQLR